MLQLLARLLLENGARSETLTRVVAATAAHLGIVVSVVAAYRAATLVADDGRSLHASAAELRIDVAASIATQQIVEDLCADRITLDEAVHRLERVERLPPQRLRWMVASLFGVAASALAWLLLADWGAIAVSGVAAALGLLARRALARRAAVLVAQPFAAALIGATLGGIVILGGWTSTPALCLVVPALMVVPGPHLITGLDDLLDNHVSTGIARLALAASLLGAAAAGVMLGAWLTVGTIVTGPAASASMTLPVDVGLAGLAALGFGAAFNAPWPVLWVSIVCGMVGHGIRFVSLEAGAGVPAATLFACLAIGSGAAWAGERLRAPFAAVAFAAAVPMMPGVSIYRSIASALRLSATGMAADPLLAATTLALRTEAILVITAMAVGLIAGARVVRIGRSAARGMTQPERPAATH